MEELSLAHILNAEAEKIQFALGTLETAGGQASSMTDILETNKLASKMVRNVIKNQMLLSMKMEGYGGSGRAGTACHPACDAACHPARRSARHRTCHPARHRAHRLTRKTPWTSDRPRRFRI